MARTLAFDRDAVTRAAREVFWRKGFGETSLADLEQATGLSRSSIYNSFDSKRGLFDAAVQNYLDEVIRPRLRPLQRQPVSTDALLSYLDGLREAFTRIDLLPGCLLVNTANSQIGEDRDVARVILDYQSELNAALSNGVVAYLPHATPEERHRVTDSVTDLVIAAFALVRVTPETAVRTLETARDIIATAPSHAPS